MRFRTLIHTLFAAAALVLASSAIAAPPAGGADNAAHHADGDHADDGHGDGHAEGDHGDGHGDDHGGHHYFTEDDDGDGTVNWLDSDSDQYAVAKLGYHLLNLVIFLGIIVYVVRTPMQDALRTRALVIRKGLEDSAGRRDDAQARYDEVASRLEMLSDEIASLRAQADKDAKAEAEALVARARVEAERIAETAERNIREEVSRARAALRSDAVALAVELAESTLKESINADDQQRLARDFLSTIHEDGADDHA